MFKVDEAVEYLTELESRNTSADELYYSDEEEESSDEDDESGDEDDESEDEDNESVDKEDETGSEGASGPVPSTNNNSNPSNLNIVLSKNHPLLIE